MALDLATIVNNAIATANTAVTLTQPALLIEIVEGAIDPGNPTAPPSKVEFRHNATGFVSASRTYYNSTDTAVRGDRTVSLLGASIENGAIPYPNWAIEIGGQRFEILSGGIRVDPANALYECQCKFWPAPTRSQPTDLTIAVNPAERSRIANPVDVGTDWILELVAAERSRVAAMVDVAIQPNLAIAVNSATRSRIANPADVIIAGGPVLVSVNSAARSRVATPVDVGIDITIAVSSAIRSRVSNQTAVALQPDISIAANPAARSRVANQVSVALQPDISIGVNSARRDRVANPVDVSVTAGIINLEHDYSNSNHSVMISFP